MLVLTNMRKIFRERQIRSDLGSWDVNVTNMESMFAGTPFDKDIRIGM